jgi:hypothetical protein
MILEKSGDGWWRGQYGNKASVLKTSAIKSGTEKFNKCEKKTVRKLMF